MQPSSVGETGELYVSGECLATGYLNNPNVTNANFIPNPFSPGNKIYKTGDIVRFLKNGVIEYISRKDNQIKINGMRVDTDAINAKIMEYKQPRPYGRGCLSTLIINKLKNAEFNHNSNNTIINLKNSGYKTPLFLIHPIGGTVFWYKHIANHFDIDRPLYGIQDPGIESNEYFFDSLEEMANFYLRHIKSVQPQGPYIIGGASFGATIAVEICQKLSKKDVVAIPVLDGWAVYPDDLKDENYFRESMQKQQDDWQKKFDIYDFMEFKKIFATQKHRLELLYSYHMKNIEHNVLLFKSREIMNIFTPIDSYDNNWGKYVDGKLEIINADGNHETMFQEPNVKKLALSLSIALDQIESLKHPIHLIPEYT